MLKKWINVYFICIAILVLGACCIVAYDCCHYIRDGEFVLLRELNMIRFPSGDDPDKYLNDATTYFDYLAGTGYNREDFWHVYLSRSMTAGVISTVLAILFSWINKEIVCSNTGVYKKYTKACIWFFFVATLALILFIRLITNETYASVEASFNYPIVYFLFPR